MRIAAPLAVVLIMTCCTTAYAPAQPALILSSAPPVEEKKVEPLVTTWCNLGEFKYIALITHHPYERKEKIKLWLNKYGANCNKEDIAKIYNNLAQLLGTSDDGEIRILTYELYMNAKNVGKN